MAGYVLARFTFPGNRIIFYAFMGGMLFPVMLALVPLFFLLQSLKIIDSLFRPDPGVYRLFAAVHHLLHDRVP